MSDYAYNAPFSLGNDMGPQPWSPGGALGTALQLILPLIGGTDSAGQPFLRMPVMSPDERTIPQRIFAENTRLLQQQMAMAQKAAEAQTFSRLVSIVGGADTALGKVGLGAMQPILSGLMRTQDSTAGALRQGIMQKAGMIMAGMTGGRPFDNPAANADALARISQAAWHATWGDTYSKQLSYTYGLTEKEMAPLMSRMIASGRFQGNIQAGQELREKKAKLQAQLEGTQDEDARKDLERQIGDIDTQLSANQIGLENAVQKAGKSIHKVVASMKALYGSATAAAAALEQTYGRGIYGDGQDANLARERSRANQLITIAGKYGMDPTVLGASVMNTANMAGTALGYSAAEQAAGYGGGIGLNLGQVAVFSANQAAGGNTQLFQKLLPGYNQRMTNAARSNNMKVQTMLQYAKEKGLIGDAEFDRIAQALTSGEASTRSAAIRDLFEQAYGGYNEGLGIMRDANAMGLMTDSLSNEAQQEVTQRLADAVGNEGTTAKNKAAFNRRTAAARNALKQAGKTGVDINATSSQGAIQAMREALGADSDIVRGASSVEASARAEADRMGLQGSRRDSYINSKVQAYYEDAAGVYLSPEESSRVLEAGREGAAKALEAEAKKNSQGSDLGRKIDFALRRKGWSKEEIQKLRDARNALRSGNVQEAERLFNSFISSTGARGAAIQKHFANQRVNIGGSMDEVDRGRAGTAAGMGISESNTLGRGTATQGTEQDLKDAAALDAQIEEEAAKDENSLATSAKDLVQGKAAAVFQNPNANQSEWDKESPIGQLIEGLKRMLRELFPEVYAQITQDNQQAGAPA